MEPASMSEMEYASMSEMEPASMSVPAPTEKIAPTDPLEATVALQTFDGYWKWAHELFVALNVDIGRVLTGLGDEWNTPSDKLATAVVLEFLEEKLGGRKDEWEMLAAKAYQWLGAAMTSEQADRLVRIVRSIVANL
jgi:hypothetical protein